MKNSFYYNVIYFQIYNTILTRPSFTQRGFMLKITWPEMASQIHVICVTVSIETDEFYDPTNIVLDARYFSCVISNFKLIFEDF